MRQLLGRALVDPSPEGVKVMGEIFSESANLFFSLLRRVSPNVDQSEFYWRAICVVGAFTFAESYTERLTQFIGNRVYMRMAEGHCAALTYDSASAEFLCSIYERRPDVCRALERGSGHCAAERAEKSERPLVMLRTSRDG